MLLLLLWSCEMVTSTNQCKRYDRKHWKGTNLHVNYNLMNNKHIGEQCKKIYNIENLEIDNTSYSERHNHNILRMERKDWERTTTREANLCFLCFRIIYLIEN